MVVLFLDMTSFVLVSGEKIHHERSFHSTLNKPHRSFFQEQFVHVQHWPSGKRLSIDDIAWNYGGRTCLYRVHSTCLLPKTSLVPFCYFLPCSYLDLLFLIQQVQKMLLNSEVVGVCYRYEMKTIDEIISPFYLLRSESSYNFKKHLNSSFHWLQFT